MTASDGAGREADQPVRGHEQPVLLESARAGERAAEEVAEGVAGEGQEQAAEQHPAPVEQLPGEERARGEQEDADDRQQAEREQRGLAQDGQAALAEGPPVGERPPDLLLDREEEAGSEDEGGEPELVDRRRRVRPQPIAGEGEEGVGGEAGDDEPDRHRDRALRHQGPDVPGRDR